MSAMNFLKRSRPWISTVVYVVLYAIGVYIRYRFIMIDHDPRQFVDSDMKTYVDIAHRWARSDYQLGLSDVIFPPGAPMLFATLFRMDQTMFLAVRFMFVITSLVPLAFFGLGWAAFGKEVGLGSLVATSFYVAFIHYGGFFLSEIPMTLLLGLSLCLFLWSTRMRATWLAVALAVTSGFICSLAVAFKFVAMPAVIGFAVVYALFFRGPAHPEPPGPAALSHPPPRWFSVSGPLRAIKAITLAGVIAGAAPLTVAMSVRCTHGNGSFCLISNKSPADFLLGHYGRVEAIVWNGENSLYAFGSPAASQHHYTARPEVNFALTDAKRNTEEAWRWIGNNRAEAVLLSFEHVYDAFGGSMPWPPNVNDTWMASEGSQFAFLLLVLVPALGVCFTLWNENGLRGLLGSREFLLLSPVLGLIAALMAATGEARYRVPFDGLFIVVAVAFYRRYFVNRKRRLAERGPGGAGRTTGAGESPLPLQMILARQVDLES
jgi:hypothetical protein